VRAETNQGFVRNCTDGASVARGEYILFLNNDTAFTEGWLTALVAVLDADPGAGIVGPMLLYGNGQLQEAGGIVWEDGSGWNFGRMDDPTGPEYNYRRQTDYVSGACLLIRKSLWQELGGFDQRYVPAYYEDTDLCFSARSAGFKVVYQPTARVYHFEGISHGTDLGAGVKKHQAINQEKFLEKWRATLQSEHFPNGQQLFFARDRSRARRTVLVIDHYVPSFDKDAGSRSTWQYLQLMVEMGYNVKFIGANFFPHQPYTRALQAIGIEVLTGEKMARGYRAWLRDNAARIDAVYVHRPHVAEQFSGALKEMSPRPRLIYFGHDLHFLRVQRECAVTGDEKLQSLSDEWKRRELAVFASFDKVYYPSQVEVDVIAHVAPETDASAIPLYVLEDQGEVSYCREDTSDILFVAGFSHPPNLDGLCWFVDEVLPLVLESCPGLRLQVVGSSAPAVVTAMASEHVVIHGYLSDEELSRLYRQVRMVAVPLRFGAGVKGKVLEALQHGRPLVTTAVGAEGLPAADSIFNIEDSAAGFAQALVELEQGDQARLGKLDHYRDYLNRYFSKARAREILSRDFGEPEIQREAAR
jgi:glycosyltransferase involved in cell wall biosynthesis